MDPLTATILPLVTAALELAKLVIESQPPEVRAELWKLHLERERAFMEFWRALRPPAP